MPATQSEPRATRRVAFSLRANIERDTASRGSGGPKVGNEAPLFVILNGLQD